VRVWSVKEERSKTPYVVSYGELRNSTKAATKVTTKVYGG
jgi:hypothetical protein